MLHYFGGTVKETLSKVTKRERSTFPIIHNYGVTSLHVISSQSKQTFHLLQVIEVAIDLEVWQVDDVGQNTVMDWRPWKHICVIGETERNQEHQKNEQDQRHIQHL